MTTRQAIEERIRFEELLRKNGVENAVECANSLRRLARKLSRHNERECSDERYCNHTRQDGSTEATRTEATLMRSVARLAKLYALKLEVGGDPRGYSLRVMGFGVGNTWGGPEYGYGVPEE